MTPDREREVRRSVRDTISTRGLGEVVTAEALAIEELRERVEALEAARHVSAKVSVMAHGWGGPLVPREIESDREPPAISCEG